MFELSYTCIILRVFSALKHQKYFAYCFHFKNPATFLGILGIFTVLGGSLLYTFVKMGENRAARSVIQQQAEEKALAEPEKSEAESKV